MLLRVKNCIYSDLQKFNVAISCLDSCQGPTEAPQHESKS